MNVYEIVSRKILDSLEQGVIPWERPWRCMDSVNWKTEKSYRGINQILLDGGEYATFKQIAESGGKVKKGEKGHIVTFFKMKEKEDENGKVKQMPLLRYYTVFEINSQCEGLTSKRPQGEEKPRIEEAEKIKRDYADCPRIISVDQNSAYYAPLIDIINIPDLDRAFKSAEGYYSVLFHEMIHSTGHATRLNRSGIADMSGSKKQVYSKEELVAEFGASFLRAKARINGDCEMKNSVAYIQHWRQFIKESGSQVLVRAASAAQKAADYILNTSLNTQES